jgi:ribulose-phosphate 3-epimerase
MLCLAPSILSADFGRLEQGLRAIEEAGAQAVHIDVMDGRFVPNITIGPVVVEAVRKYTDLPLDVHLMIENPGDYLDAFIDAGATWISFHAEATNHAHRLSQHLRDRGIKAGIAINPGTPVETLSAMIEHIDFALIMSVNPGFGGQDFIPESLPKIARLRNLIERIDPDVTIEVDGGITVDNAEEVLIAGAEILVAGSAVFGRDDIREAVGDFLEIFRSVTK